jgi:hypothetical protein
MEKGYLPRGSSNQAQTASLSDWIAIYPSGRGRYALGNPDGRELLPGQRVELVLAGITLSGVVRHGEMGDYLLLDTGEKCGLCPEMRVIPRDRQVQTEQVMEREPV